MLDFSNRPEADICSLGKTLNLSQKLSPQQQALYQAIDEVLHYVWDPIGVSRFPEARDEYHAYLPQVFQMLQDGQGHDDLERYLTAVSTDRMGLSANSKHDGEVAELLLLWQRRIMNTTS